MSHYRKSWGEVMNRLIETHGKGKSQEFFLFTCNASKDEYEYVLECEINSMPRSEFIDLMEHAGILSLPVEVS